MNLESVKIELLYWELTYVERMLINDIQWWVLKLQFWNPEQTALFRKINSVKVDKESLEKVIEELDKEIEALEDEKHDINRQITMKEDRIEWLKKLVSAL